MTAVSTSPSAGTAALARMIGQAWRAAEARVSGAAGESLMADMMPPRRSPRKSGPRRPARASVAAFRRVRFQRLRQALDDVGAHRHLDAGAYEAADRLRASAQAGRQEALGHGVERHVVLRTGE